VETSLDFLAMTLRDLPERHQSLRAVFARSWGLLSDPERQRFRALAVFRGGFTREAAQAVTNSEPRHLTELMDRSLLCRNSAGRYEVLEVLRQYAEEQLLAVPGEANAVRDRHVAYYLGLLESMEQPLRGGKHPEVPLSQKAALDTIQDDIANIRRAWAQAIESGSYDMLGASAMGCALYHEMRSRFREGEGLFRDAAGALERQRGVSQPDLLGLLLGMQGQFLCRLGRIEEGCEVLERARRLLVPEADSSWLALVEVLSSYVGLGLTLEIRMQRVQHSLDLYGALGDNWGVALTQEVLGELLTASGELEAAEQVLNESLAYRRSAGDTWGAALALYALADNAIRQGRAVDVAAHIEESMALRETIDDTRGVAICQSLLAGWLAHRGDVTAAGKFYEQSLDGYRRIGDLSKYADTWTALSDIAESQGDLPGAEAALIAAAQSARRAGLQARLAAALHKLGRLALAQDDTPRARVYLAESLVISGQLGDEVATASVREDLIRARELGSAGYKP
jgi:predicted ATPase